MRLRLDVLLSCFILGCLVTRVRSDLSPSLTYGASIFNLPGGVAIDPHSDAIYVVDSGNNRVLRFDNRSSLTTSSTPDMVFGQPSLTSVLVNMGGGSASDQGFNNPFDAWMDNDGTLWVADVGNSRVVWFNNARTITTPPGTADGALGQSSFTGASSTDTRQGLAGPSGVFGLDNVLWVADTANNR